MLSIQLTTLDAIWRDAPESSARKVDSACHNQGSWGSPWLATRTQKETKPCDPRGCVLVCWELAPTLAYDFLSWMKRGRRGSWCRSGQVRSWRQQKGPREKNPPTSFCRRKSEQRIDPGDQNLSGLFQPSHHRHGASSLSTAPRRRLRATRASKRSSSAGGNPHLPG